jgi:hypothetical protein
MDTNLNQVNLRAAMETELAAIEGGSPLIFFMKRVVLHAIENASGAFGDALKDALETIKKEQQQVQTQ